MKQSDLAKDYLSRISETNNVETYNDIENNFKLTGHVFTTYETIVKYKFQYPECNYISAPSSTLYDLVECNRIKLDTVALEDINEIVIGEVNYYYINTVVGTVNILWDGE